MKRISIILLSAATSFTVACSNDSDNPTDGDDQTQDGVEPGDEWERELAKREVDYNAALRTASLRLVGDLPTMTEINRVKDAGDLAAQKLAYEELLRDYMSRPAFARQMFYFWRDTFQMGETAEMDTAPAFAAMLSVQDRPFTELFTASTGACPTFNAGTGVFTPADCTGNGPKVGVLTNQGVMKHYYGNFAFRRVKWVQETFDCAKFPIDLTGAPVEVGGATPYTGSFPHDSIAGTANGGRVNFREAVAVQCAHCHQHLNHIAPLFANYDQNGAYQNQIAVRTPLPGEPRALAADPDVAKCSVARIWNWAMGKGDIVDLLHEVPAETIQAQVDSFTQSGQKMKDLIFAVYASEDFAKF
ncbi:MAG TPA: hypothetical protein VK932_18420 [Kofleriaceae bacterium]|nr:hypothetical protein [Kofleriaceae bacterium]